jgi:hypothetical protein
MQKPNLKKKIYIYIYHLEIGDPHFRRLTGWKKKTIGDEMFRHLKFNR